MHTARDETAARLAAIVASSEDAIISKDLNGYITSWNAAAERMFGYTAAEIVGRHITTIIPLERHAEEDYVINEIARAGAVDHFETVRCRKDGSLIDVSLTVSPIRAERRHASSARRRSPATSPTASGSSATRSGSPPSSSRPTTPSSART